MIRYSLKHKKRLTLILVLLLAIGSAVALTLYALKQNINLFFTPTDLVQQQAPMGASIRMGGLVLPGSVIRSEHDLSLVFVLTDKKNNITVHYSGILPDLFRENQGIVVLGTWQADQTFLATEVLAKHDENYMPPEVLEALQRADATEAQP